MGTIKIVEVLPMMPLPVNTKINLINNVQISGKNDAIVVVILRTT
jgi:hypothetical protein